MTYCKKCNISYDNKAEFFDNEYQEECPVCKFKYRLDLQQNLLKATQNELRIYHICEECQNLDGACDRDRTTCPKLQTQLNSKS